MYMKFQIKNNLKFILWEVLKKFQNLLAKRTQKCLPNFKKIKLYEDISMKESVKFNCHINQLKTNQKKLQKLTIFN